MPFRQSSSGKGLQSPTSDRPSGSLASRSTTTKRLYDPARDTEVEVPVIRGSPDPPQRIEREPSPPPRPRSAHTPSPISSPAADTTRAADESIADAPQAEIAADVETELTVPAGADDDADADGEAETEVATASRPQKRAPARRRPAKRRKSAKVVEAEDTASAAGDAPRLPPTFGEVAEANALRAGKTDTAAAPAASPAPTPRRSAASRRRRTTPAVVKEEVDESMADASAMAVESEPESSDSDGSYAISLRGEDAEPPVTICRWHEDDEPAPCNEDLQATDRLVRHVQDAHLGQRKPRYTCEWVECPRKGVAQGSRFALTAHMRAHTGEKPFICQQPECDKTFTRSDALAKHMRSSHNSEPRRGARANLDQADAELAVEKLGDDYNVVPNAEKLEAAIKAPSVTALLADDAEVQEIVSVAAAAAASAAGARKRRRQNGHGHGHGHVDPSTGGGGAMGSDSDDELPEDTIAQWRQLKQRYKWATDRARDLDDALRVAEAELAHERLLKERLLDDQIRKELGANAALFLY